MEILGRLFGSQALVKILRLFLFNPDEVYERKDIAKHTRVSADVVSYKLSVLKSIGLIRQKIFYKESLNKKTSRVKNP